jgi:hypothetical protein
MASGDTMDVVLQITRELYSNGVLKQKTLFYFFFFLLDTTLGSSSFKISSTSFSVFACERESASYFPQHWQWRL